MTEEENTNQPLDLDKEYGANNTGKPPGFLMVLIVLTTINVVYNIYTALKELFVAAESTASVEAQVYSSIEESGADISELPAWIMEGLVDFIEKFSNNAIMIRVTDIVYYLLLGVAAFLMFRLKLAGFYVYVIVNVIGVLLTPVLFGFNFVGIAVAIVYAIVATVFIALYSANRKHLN